MEELASVKHKINGMAVAVAIPGFTGSYTRHVIKLKDDKYKDTERWRHYQKLLTEGYLEKTDKGPQE